MSAASLVPDWGVVARITHILAVVVWIGGVWLVTTVLFPGMRRMPAEEWVWEFEAIERRFAPQARIAVLLTLVSGLYMVHEYALWDRLTQGAFWWMHLMVLVDAPHGWCVAAVRRAPLLH